MERLEAGLGLLHALQVIAQLAPVLLVELSLQQFEDGGDGRAEADWRAPLCILGLMIERLAT